LFKPPYENKRGTLKAVAKEMTAVEGQRGAIKKRTAQIEKRTAQQPETKVSMMGAADN
jgi:hypothetical protein